MWDLRSGTQDPEESFQQIFSVLFENLAFINEFMCFMRLSLVSMFLITLS